jgi:glycosyltransferase involved in cell wall biosynthesis
VIVHTFHGHVFEGYFSPFMTAVFVRIERWLARRSDALVAISPLIGRDLLETYRIARDEQTFVIPLGFDLSPFVTIDAEARQSARAALGVAPDRFVVSTVGRLTEIKRHDLFLDMARQVAARVPAVEFLIVGDGELRRDLESQAAALGIGGQVRFLGWRTDLRTIYGATDVFVLTSRNEGTPVALIEALASGVPGVSTDVGGVRDVVADGETGLVVPFGSPEALAASVAALLASPERRREMGARGRKAVLSKFHFQRLADDVASLYGERLRARRGVKFGVI